ncbi:MAG: nucleoside transporter C-terminal domain-containing protein [Litorimonas sp.]
MSGLIGLAAFLALAWLCSENRSAVRIGDAARTLALQITVGALALLTPVGTAVLGGMSRGVQSAIDYANEGIRFMFGPLADPGEGGAGGVILAFQVLPVIIFIAALLSVFFHLGVMRVVIRVIGGAIGKLTGAGKLESTTAAANIFVGMAEAPLAILPYLPRLSRAQLFCVMSLGLASVAGSVLAAYAALGVRTDLLLTAAVMAAPGGLLMARILVPETGEPLDIDTPDPDGDALSTRAASVIDALTRGALTGLQIMLSVIAVLITFVALIALINGLLGGIGGWFGAPDLTLQQIAGVVFAPFAWLIGVPWSEAAAAGRFLGEKVIVNEFIAYASFVPQADTFSERGQIAITVALCGFANLTGLAVLIAAMTAAVPERRADVSKLGLKAVLAGTLSNFTSAAIVSVLLAVQAML